MLRMRFFTFLLWILFFCYCYSRFIFVNSLLRSFVCAPVTGFCCHYVIRNETLFDGSFASTFLKMDVLWLNSHLLWIKLELWPQQNERASKLPLWHALMLWLWDCIVLLVYFPLFYGENLIILCVRKEPFYANWHLLSKLFFFSLFSTLFELFIPTISYFFLDIYAFLTILPIWRASKFSSTVSTLDASSCVFLTQSFWFPQEATKSSTICIGR